MRKYSHIACRSWRKFKEGKQKLGKGRKKEKEERSEKEKVERLVNGMENARRRSEVYQVPKNGSSYTAS